MAMMTPSTHARQAFTSSTGNPPAPSSRGRWVL